MSKKDLKIVPINEELRNFRTSLIKDKTSRTISANTSRYFSLTQTCSDDLDEIEFEHIASSSRGKVTKRFKTTRSRTIELAKPANFKPVEGDSFLDVAHIFRRRAGNRFALNCFYDSFY